MHKKRIMLGAIIAGLLALGAVSAVAAEERDAGSRPGHQRERVVGHVVGEHGNILELRTRQGPQKVHWTEDTKCFLNRERVRCEDISVGQGVLAVGWSAGESEQFHAKLIRARDPQPRVELD